MRLGVYQKFIVDLDKREDCHRFQVQKSNGEWLMGEIISTADIPIVFFNGADSTGHPTVITMDVIRKGDQPTREQVELSVEDIVSYEVYTKVIKPNAV